MKRIFAILILAAAGRMAADEPPSGTPFAQEAFWAPVMEYSRPGRIHGLVNVDCTDHYVTSHGLHLENQGMIIQPLLLFSTSLYSKPADWLGNITLTMGGWGTWHSHEGGQVPANWREVDLLGGLTFTLDGDWKLSAFYSAYLSQTHSYPTAWELAVALVYDDSNLLGDFALHPFAEFKRQTEGSTTVIFAPDWMEESYTFRAGIAPQRVFDGFKLEFPAYLTVVPGQFYQRSVTAANGSRSAGIGFFSAALKGTVPLKSASSEAVQTSLYGAVQYYRLVNQGLLDGNEVLGATSRRQENILQFHAGLTVAF